MIIVSRKPVLTVYEHDLHRCDEFESHIREIFRSFQGGF